MNGSWGTAGNYNVTLSFINAKDFSESSSASKLRLTIASSTSATYQTVAEVAANSTTLSRVNFTFDVSQFVTPASLQKVYCKFVMVKSDGSILVNSSLTNGTIKSTLGDNYATLAYAKANEPPSTLTFTTSNSNYQDFDKPLTISWNAVTQTGSYAPHHYKVWIRFSYDDGATWVTDNNYIGIGWGIEGTSYTFTLKDLHLDTKNLNDYSRFKLRIGMATLDNKNGSEVTRSSVKWFVMTPYVINTSGGNLSFHTVNNGQVSIGVNNVKTIKPINNMKIKILDDGSEWARIFWHDVSSTATYFANENEVLSCNLSNRFSNLTNIDNYRYNGAFELMLCYPKYSNSKYNRWIQRANPITTWDTTKQTKSTMGYEPIHIDFKTNWLYGMARTSDGNSSYARFDCMAGHTNWFGAIGQYKSYNGGFPAPTESGMSNIQKEVELWVRINNTIYFDKTTKGKMVAKIYDNSYFSDIMNFLHMGLITDNMVIELYNNITYSATWFCENFKGHIYGNGYTINITSQNVDCLFKQNSGIIEDLVIAGRDIKVTSSIGKTGGICRVNTGKIINCINNRKIVGNESYPSAAGGICGENSGEIIKCLNRANIDNSSTTDASMITGGIVGKNSGLILGCRSGWIDSDNDNAPKGVLLGYNVGGIAGYTLAGSKIQDCMTWCSLSGYYVGGIVGYSYKGEINHCLNMSTINKEQSQVISGEYFGGLCGYNNYGTYQNNYYDGLWSKASVEYDSSNPINSQSPTQIEYRSANFASKIGLPYIYINTHNSGMPSFSWERSSKIEPDDYWGITDCIWVENYSTGEPTNIKVHFERSFGQNGKHKKLDITIETLYRIWWSSGYYI